MTHRDIFRGTLIFAIGLMIYLYIFNFNNYGETELVEFSFSWFTLLIFSIYGFVHLGKQKSGVERIWPQNAIVYALLHTAYWLAGFIAFYYLIWPEL